VFGFRNLGIKARLAALVGVFVGGTALFGAFAFTTLNSVVVGSDLDKTLDINKDVKEDFYPPSAALLPANFLLYRMVASNNHEDIRTYMAKFEEAKRDFDNRRQFWVNRLTNGELREALKKTFEQADEFFLISQNEIFPLLDAGKMEQANRLRHEKLVPLYAAHEQAIQEFARLNDRQDAEERARVESVIQWRRNLMIAMLMIFVLIGGTIAWFIARGISTPVLEMASAMQRLVERDMSASVDSFSIGPMRLDGWRRRSRTSATVSSRPRN